MPPSRPGGAARFNGLVAAILVLPLVMAGVHMSTSLSGARAERNAWRSSFMHPPQGRYLREDLQARVKSRGMFSSRGLEQGDKNREQAA